MRTSAELREGFLSFFESKGHKRHPSGSLVPPDWDRSTLLNSAGMQPLMPYFLGRETPPAPLLTTVQKVTGLVTGLSYGASTLAKQRDWRSAVQAGKDAAAKREQELADELHRSEAEPKPGDEQ